MRVLILLATFGIFVSVRAQHHAVSHQTSKKRSALTFEEEGEHCTNQWREVVVNFTTERQDQKVFFGGSVRLIAEQPKVFFDVRMSMPHGPATVTYGVGYPIRLKRDGCLVLSPAFYLHAGTFTGISPGFVMRYEKKHWFVITSNQFLVSAQPLHNHHLFSVTTFDYRLTKWFDVGAELEILYDGKKDAHHVHIENHTQYFNTVATQEFWFGTQFRFRVGKNNRNLIEATLLQNLAESKFQRLTLTYSHEF